MDSTASIAGSLLTTLLWPAAAAVSLSVALGGRNVSLLGLLLVACGTMAAYGLDRLIDKQSTDPPSLRSALILGVLIASMATGILGCTAWWRFKVCGLLALVAGAYVPLKRIIPKNILTTVAWTTATATLPFSVLPPIDTAFVASVVTVAMIMLANTILCDIPDVEADRRDGVRGVTPWLGPRAGAITAVVCGLLGAIVASWFGRWGLAVTALGLAVLAILLARNSDQRFYRSLADGLVTLIPGPVAFFFR